MSHKSVTKSVEYLVAPRCSGFRVRVLAARQGLGNLPGLPGSLPLQHFRVLSCQTTPPPSPACTAESPDETLAAPVRESVRPPARPRQSDRPRGSSLACPRVSSAHPPSPVAAQSLLATSLRSVHSLQPRVACFNSSSSANQVLIGRRTSPHAHWLDLASPQRGSQFRQTVTILLASQYCRIQETLRITRFSH